MFPRRAAMLTAGSYFLLLLLITLPVWAPLTRPGIPLTQVGILPVLDDEALPAQTNSLANPTLFGWRQDGPWSSWVTGAMATIGIAPAAAQKDSLIIALLLLAMSMMVVNAVTSGWRAGILAAALVLYAPLHLSAIYHSGDWAQIWTLAGMGVAIIGLVWTGRGNWIWVGLGSFLAVTAAPGLGLWAAIALLALALARRRWLALLTLLLASGLALMLLRPWSGAVIDPMAMVAGVSLHQIFEPAWEWQLSGLSRDVVLSYSLGVPLIGLVMIRVWTRFSQVQATNRGGEEHGFAHLGATSLAIGLILVLCSLDFVTTRLPLIGATIAEPWHLVLLALPFLALVGAATLRAYPLLRHPALFGALLALVMLAAGPALSPTFSDGDVPSDPVAVFGDDLLLLQLTTQGSLEPGSSLSIRADWSAIEPPDFDYSIFIHAVDQDGDIIAQLDTQPLAGERPMTTWQPGELLVDRYQLTLPADAPPDLHLRLGIYNWQTMDRLRVGEFDAWEWRP